MKYIKKISLSCNNFDFVIVPVLSLQPSAQFRQCRKSSCNVSTYVQVVQTSWQRGQWLSCSSLRRTRRTPAAWRARRPPPLPPPRPADARAGRPLLRYTIEVLYSGDKLIHTNGHFFSDNRTSLAHTSFKSNKNHLTLSLVILQ